MVHPETAQKKRNITRNRATIEARKLEKKKTWTLKVALQASYLLVVSRVKFVDCVRKASTV